MKLPVDNLSISAIHQAYQQGLTPSDFFAALNQAINDYDDPALFISRTSWSDITIL